MYAKQMVKIVNRNILNSNIEKINTKQSKDKENKQSYTKQFEKIIKIESENYYIKPEKYETERSYKIRIKYIEEYNPKNLKELRESIVYSKVYRNIKILGCIYEKDLENKVKFKIIKNNK